MWKWPEPSIRSGGVGVGVGHRARCDATDHEGRTERSDRRDARRDPGPRACRKRARQLEGVGRVRRAQPAAPRSLADSRWATPRTRRASSPCQPTLSPGAGRRVRRALRRQRGRGPAAGIERVFGAASGQRCVRHERRNPERHLPKELAGILDTTRRRSRSRRMAR